MINSEELDLKYRPKKFSEICGNSDEVSVITNMLARNALSKVVVLYGPPGCCKTTLSFLITARLKCQSPVDKTGEPCGVCSSCVSIYDSLYKTGEPVRGASIFSFDMSLNGSDEDYISKVESAISSKMTSERVRIILLEELHITDPILQEKLNKALEFIPKNVYVIIMTTNLKKIAKPILSRAQVIHLQNPTAEEQLPRIRQICLSENIKLTNKQVLKLLDTSGNNARQVLKYLNTIRATGDVGIQVLIDGAEAHMSEYIEYFASIKLGILSLIDFIENTLKEPARFFNGLDDFIHTCIQSRYNSKCILSDNMRSIIKEKMVLFSDRVLIDTIKSVEKVGYCTDKDAKRHLMVIGYDMNPKLYETINVSDAQNSMSATDVKITKEEQINIDLISSAINKSMGEVNADDF